MNSILTKTININDFKYVDNTHLVCQLYRICEELSIECFDDNDLRDLCYDQLCIVIDSVDDNVVEIKLMKTLTFTVFENGLCNINYTLK